MDCGGCRSGAALHEEEVEEEEDEEEGKCQPNACQNQSSGSIERRSERISRLSGNFRLLLTYPYKLIYVSVKPPTSVSILGQYFYRVVNLALKFHSKHIGWVTIFLRFPSHATTPRACCSSATRGGVVMEGGREERRRGGGKDYYSACQGKQPHTYSTHCINS